MESMDKDQIVEVNLREYEAFVALINELSPTEFESAPESKWTPGQQMEHLAKSIKPLALALHLPESVLKWKFGVANRPSRTYEGLVARYLEKIQPGYVAQKQYQPRSVAFSDKEKWTRRLLRSVRVINRLILKMSEEQLDRIIAPHPAIGKLTLREMMYFTIYHAEHHQNLILRDQKILNA